MPITSKPKPRSDHVWNQGRCTRRSRDSRRRCIMKRSGALLGQDGDGALRIGTCRPRRDCIRTTRSSGRAGASPSSSAFIRRRPGKVFSFKSVSTERLQMTWTWNWIGIMPGQIFNGAAWPLPVFTFADRSSSGPFQSWFSFSISFDVLDCSYAKRSATVLSSSVWLLSNALSGRGWFKVI